jgi:hypothetical protein
MKLALTVVAVAGVVAVLGLIFIQELERRGLL